LPKGERGGLLTIMLVAAGVAVEMFLPLFGRILGGLPPVASPPS